VTRPEHHLGATRGAPVAPQSQAKHPTIGQLVGEAMARIERHNSAVKVRVGQGLRPPHGTRALNHVLEERLKTDEAMILIVRRPIVHIQ
jgi:hypothetical protein